MDLLAGTDQTVLVALHELERSRTSQLLERARQRGADRYLVKG
jgi:hypothetical protein